MAAWARICKLMGEGFAQYLPLVMPAVLKAAAFKPDVTGWRRQLHDSIGRSNESPAVCGSEEVDPEDEEQKDWQFVTLGDNQAFGIRTAGMEEKAAAMEMIETYATTLKHAFCPYVEPVFDIALPMLKFFFHDDVRTAAAGILPALITVASFYTIL